MTRAAGLALALLVTFLSSTALASTTTTTTTTTTATAATESAVSTSHLISARASLNATTLNNATASSNGTTTLFLADPLDLLSLAPTVQKATLLLNYISAAASVLVVILYATARFKFRDRRAVKLPVSRLTLWFALAAAGGCVASLLLMHSGQISPSNVTTASSQKRSMVKTESMDDVMQLVRQLNVKIIATNALIIKASVFLSRLFSLWKMMLSFVLVYQLARDFLFKTPEIPTEEDEHIPFGLEHIHLADQSRINLGLGNHSTAALAQAVSEISGASVSNQQPQLATLSVHGKYQAAAAALAALSGSSVNGGGFNDHHYGFMTFMPAAGLSVGFLLDFDMDYSPDLLAIAADIVPTTSQQIRTWICYNGWTLLAAGLGFAIVALVLVKTAFVHIIRNRRRKADMRMAAEQFALGHTTTLGEKEAPIVDQSLRRRIYAGLSYGQKKLWHIASMDLVTVLYRRALRTAVGFLAVVVMCYAGQALFNASASLKFETALLNNGIVTVRRVLWAWSLIGPASFGVLQMLFAMTGPAISPLLIIILTSVRGVFSSRKGNGNSSTSTPGMEMSETKYGGSGGDPHNMRKFSTDGSVYNGDTEDYDALSGLDSNTNWFGDMVPQPRDHTNGYPRQFALPDATRSQLQRDIAFERGMNFIDLTGGSKVKEQAQSQSQSQPQQINPMLVREKTSKLKRNATAKGTAAVAAKTKTVPELVIEHMTVTSDPIASPTVAFPIGGAIKPANTSNAAAATAAAAVAGGGKIAQVIAEGSQRINERKQQQYYFNMHQRMMQQRELHESHEQPQEDGGQHYPSEVSVNTFGNGGAGLSANHQQQLSNSSSLPPNIDLFPAVVTPTTPFLNTLTASGNTDTILGGHRQQSSLGTQGLESVTSTNASNNSLNTVIYDGQRANQRTVTAVRPAFGMITNNEALPAHSSSTPQQRAVHRYEDMDAISECTRSSVSSFNYDIYKASAVTTAASSGSNTKQ
ncbi:hypothetical protein GQ42DRAFT_161878, partial [Ramicandelaber brevisporus]